MGAKIPDIGRIVIEFAGVVIKFFDDAFQNGYLWMFLAGFVIFVIIIIIFG